MDFNDDGTENKSFINALSEGDGKTTCDEDSINHLFFLTKKRSRGNITWWRLMSLFVCDLCRWTDGRWKRECYVKTWQSSPITGWLKSHDSVTNGMSWVPFPYDYNWFLSLLKSIFWVKWVVSNCETQFYPNCSWYRSLTRPEILDDAILPRKLRHYNYCNNNEQRRTVENSWENTSADVRPVTCSSTAG